MKQHTIVILDLGSRENTVLARDIRALGVYSEIHPHDLTMESIKAIGDVKGIIVNGGPNNVVDGHPIFCDDAVYSGGIPVFVVGHSTPQKAADLSEWPENPDAYTATLSNFLFAVCKAEKNWSMENFIADQIDLIRKQVGVGKVLLALSGGVDSSVVAALLVKAIGKQLVCVHVNHGLLRLNEPEQVIEVFTKQFDANLIYVDAAERFLSKLENVDDPEQKRKIIGEEFIRVFEEEAKKLAPVDFLAQGTIYPDVIESGTKTVKGVKAHHNVGGLPENLAFDLVEPIKQLFKDEVRACGIALGLPLDMVYRQPFPGPGLGVRCLGAITRPRLDSLRHADAILREEFAANGLSETVWQYFAVIPNFRSVGVRNDARTYEYPVILRAVNTVDAMTASISHIPWDTLDKISNRILREVAGINRVCYDLTPKPPGTIEWE